MMDGALVVLWFQNNINQLLFLEPLILIISQKTLLLALDKDFSTNAWGLYTKLPQYVNKE
jgi:hypothetical protein